MRKKNYITEISEKDIKAFKLLRCCHHANTQQLKTFITENRIESYRKQGIIERIHHMKNRKDTEVVFELSKKGREWIKRHVPELKSHTFYTGSSIRHDLKLAEVYLSKFNDMQEWYTERDLYKMFREQMIEEGRWAEAEERYNKKEITMPDGCYISKTGEIECVEILSEYYTQSMISSKIEFADMMGIPIYFEKC